MNLNDLKPKEKKTEKNDDILSDIKNSRPVVGANDRRKSSQYAKQYKPTQDIPTIGSSCRDCLNNYYGTQLSRSDCKYEKQKDGHRKLEICACCGKMRPIVLGLTIMGRAKTIGKKIQKVN